MRICPGRALSLNKSPPDFDDLEVELYKLQRAIEACCCANPLPEAEDG
jgi:hypothetical protein